MAESDLKIGAYSKEIEVLYQALCSLYERYGKTDACRNLQAAYQSPDLNAKISIAFVGQYSAGKSTILKALTGNADIVTDSDISTSEVMCYPWNSNILLWDTPGLNTNENKTHDEKTADAIRKADLLVYCITSDLFREVTRDDFKALAADYQQKLFLVINKMNAENGAYEELVEHYSLSINKTLAPEYSLAEFHHYFVDAYDYIEGKKTQDEEFIEDSHFTGFIAALNRFCAQKGLSGKMLTPVALLGRSVEEMLDETEDDAHRKEGKALIRRVRNAVAEKIGQFRKSCISEIEQQCLCFREKGDEVAARLGEKGYTFTDKEYQQFYEPIQENLCRMIQENFEHYAAEADAEAQRVIHSELAEHFFTEEKRRLEQPITAGTNKAAPLLSHMKQGIDVAAETALPKIEDYFGQIANVSKGEDVTIWTVKGTDLHKMVKTIGNKLGHRFKPFEALKISKRIAEMSQWVGPVLAGAATVTELVGIFTDSLNEKKLNRQKEAVKLSFRGMGEETESYFRRQVEEAAEEMEAICQALDEELDRIDALSTSERELRTELAVLQNSIRTCKRRIEQGE